MRRKNSKHQGKAAVVLRAKLLPWLLVVPGAYLAPQVALAQQTLAQIQGTVKDENGKPLAGVTVVVQSPALQGEQAEITDNNGRYIITQPVEVRLISPLTVTVLPRLSRIPGRSTRGLSSAPKKKLTL